MAKHQFPDLVQRPATLRVLIVEDNENDANLIIQALNNSAGYIPFEFEHVSTLGQARDRLLSPGIDAVLLDLYLPDSYGISTICRLFSTRPLFPIVALIGTEVEKSFVFRAGAMDYVIKGQGYENIAIAIKQAIIKFKVRLDVLKKFVKADESLIDASKRLQDSRRPNQGV